jgi:hypothetical protein
MTDFALKANLGLATVPPAVHENDKEFKQLFGDVGDLIYGKIRMPFPELVCSFTANSCIE